MRDTPKQLVIEPDQIEKAQDQSKPVARIKNNLYAHIKVSVRTMDLIIAIVAVLIVAALIAGIVIGS